MRVHKCAMTALLCGSLTVASFAAIGCSDDDDYSPPPPPPDAGTVATGTIQVMDNFFSPAEVAVPEGTTVQWINMGAILHTVTSGTNSSATDVGELFDAELSPGQTFSYTFHESGTVWYFCRPHEAIGMRGTVTIDPP